MDIEVNWLAIVLATASSLVVGSLWYSEKGLGHEWAKLVKLDKKQAAKDAKRAIITTTIVTFVTAYVLAHMTFLANYYLQHSFLFDALATAFWAWLGFTASRMITHDAFEGRRQRLTVINICHELATFMIMGLIIGLLAP
jgi:hypothetical protein